MCGMIRHGVLFTVITLFLAGCSQQQRQAGPPPPASTVETRLDDAMRRASIASARVAGIEIAAAGIGADPEADPAVGDLPAELRQRVSIDWAGPAAPLVKAVADQIGYGFVATGPAPAAPVLLTMHRRDEQAWRVLRDAGLALKTSGKIVINVPSKIVELRWPELDS